MDDVHLARELQQALSWAEALEQHAAKVQSKLSAIDEGNSEGALDYECQQFSFQ